LGINHLKKERIKLKKTSHEISWNSESYNAIEQENYSLVINIYEQEIKSNPRKISNLFYLGLAYLLNGEEDIAQMTWFSAIAGSESTESSDFHELSNILDKEADHQAEKEKVELGWIIRHHLKELDPSNIRNLIKLVILSIKLNNFSAEVLKELDFLEALKSDPKNIYLEENIFETFLSEFLKYQFTESIEIISILAHKIENKKNCVNVLLPIIHKIRPNNPEYAGNICKICSKLLPENIMILQTICWCFCTSSNFQETVRSAKVFYENSPNTLWKLMSIYLLIREMTRSGDWVGIDKYILEYKNFMYDLDKNGFSDDDFVHYKSLPIMPGLLQYCQDSPVENRFLQNSLSKILQEKINKNLLFSQDELINFAINRSKFKNKITKNKKKLRIGFLVSRLKVHSVGWLSRWFFNCYDRERFDFSIFVINQSPGDGFTQVWFESKVDKCTYFSENEFKKIAESIYLDNVDILIDMDSITSYDACLVLALKPAPIQATWLGYDSTGIPAVDYFIVDPYLLPENAQDYYSEKLWRLPQTYLAINGFEIEVPTLSRRDLEIPDDAVIYLSAQTGQKRNPETIRLQLKVLRAVPNSYLLIKGLANSGLIQDLFSELAQEEGVDLNRLRFLDLDANEFVHRANLQIADVILDTYPYNGATTTLEALWVGVPIVTRLGKQCAARNSYTFLAQVGVTDGIATTDEEYVDWGIRFGHDPQLRQKIYTQLKQSRHTSSLWNTKQFARDMEAAFLEMWDIYSQSVGESIDSIEIIRT
jgi:predicted O-linked N-acetylglucosamine transferase (SPINDLY family)